MFIEALIIAIIIGFLIKGRLTNLQYVKLKGMYIIFIAFSLEVLILISLKSHLLEAGYITFTLNLIMYVLLIAFIILNRSNKWIILIGIGFILNALPIFLNGGKMPVSQHALQVAGLNYSNVSNEGLYQIINSETKLWFLGDIIPKTIFRKFVVSIGDIISCIGMMFFIITGMKKSEN